MPVNNETFDAKKPGGVGCSTVSHFKSNEMAVAGAIAESRENIQKKEYHDALEVIDGVYDSCSAVDRVPLDGLKADCYLELDDSESALNCYTQILKVQPDAPYWAHVGFANVLERLGQNDKAVQQMSHALEKEFSLALAERVVRLSLFTTNPKDSYRTVADLVYESGTEEQVAEVAELLINEGVSDEGGRLFESIITNNGENLVLITRLVKALLGAGESKLATRRVEKWRSENTDDTRLDKLYDFCQESRILDSHNGIPCLLVENEKQLEDFELRVNGYRVRRGLKRYSSKLLDENTETNETALERYLIVIPQCYLDIKKDRYSVELIELSGAQRKYSGNYPVTKSITNERELWKGDFEYLGGNRIHGWYRSETDRADRLHLYINGEYVEEIAVNTERPDVANLHGADYLKSGFDCTWSDTLVVDQLELRNAVTGKPVLSTPIKVQRLEDAVQELEQALPKGLEKSGLLSVTVQNIYRSLREMPKLSIEYTRNSVDLVRNYEEGVSVIVPVYNGLADVKRCIASLLASNDLGSLEILCVNDCSTDIEVKTFLDLTETENESVTVINSEINRGFVKTVNKGLTARAYKDVVILNSDTVVPEKFVDRLSAACELDNKFGVITPLSNNATIYSFPLALENNELKNLDDINKIDCLLQENARDELHEMPTGHGFCMFVAGEVLETVGKFNEEEWGVGYGEENDFCQRVKMHGWKIGAYHGMYVGHVGSVSFGDEKREIQVSKNLKRLNEIYPEYDNLIQQHIKSEESSRLSRNRLQLLHFHRANTDLKDILFVSHSLGGGTTEYIKRCAENLAVEDIRSIILTTDNNNIVLCNLEKNLNCIYRMDEIQELRVQLEILNLGDLILNSTFNFPSELLENILDIAGQYTVLLHDFSWVCPRINLIDATGAYCGMPSSEVCVTCVEVSGTHESFNSQWKNISIGLDMWLTKNKALLEGARQVIAPSIDVANRIRKKFETINPVVKYHSDGFEVAENVKRYIADTVGEQIIGVFGMIGDHKGMALLKKLSWLLSSRHSGVKIVFFGGMSEKEWLDGYANVKCVGEYTQDTLGSLIQREKPTVSLFLSMWPETYCYALTDAIKHGVFPIAFDIGAFSERIKMHGFGKTIPFEVNSDEVYQSILKVLDGEEFRKQSCSDIKSGVIYNSFSTEYLDLSK